MNKTLYDADGNPILDNVAPLVMEQYLYSIIRPEEQQARITGNGQSTIFIDGKSTYTIKSNGAK